MSERLERADRAGGAVDSLLDAEGCARLLCVSIATVERLRLKAGLPAIDLGFRRPGRRPKRLWRYDPVEVREWWRLRVLRQGSGQLETACDGGPR
jgi:hypothetical protein